MTNRWARTAAAARRRRGIGDDSSCWDWARSRRRSSAPRTTARSRPPGPSSSRINALEPEFQALTDEGIRAKTAEFRERLAKGESLDDLLPEAFANAREAARRALGPAPVRRAADGRHLPAPGRHLRDEDRRGQDAGRHAAGLPQRADRARRARRHRQRLPRPPRRRVDGHGLPRPRPHASASWCPACPRRTRRPPTTPTSPTPPTTSSASTTCATT